MSASAPTPRAGAMALLRSSALAAAFATASLGALFATQLLRNLMGDAGYGAIIVGLCLLGAAMLVARRREWRWLELMPTTLAALMLWLLITSIWARDTGESLSGWLAIAAPTFLAIVVAQFRDTLQTVRTTGDVLRVLLTLSLALEVLSGILIDLPIPFLGIGGNIAQGGPVQGIFGTRTALGLITIIALITFLVEWRTRSVAPGLAVYSVTLAGVLAVLTGSPIVLVMAFVAGLATGILILVRRTDARYRATLQWAIAALLVFGLVLVYAFRRPLVYWLNAEPDFFTRSRLWNEILDLAEASPVQGWGWVGTWPEGVMPFTYLRYLTGEDHGSALNAWMDVLLQAGAVGVALFLAFAGLALARAWMTASERRSTVYVWAPLVLISLLADSIVTSSLLGGFGWFLLVVCATRASLVKGWRSGMDAGGPTIGGLPHEGPPSF
ncbi:O-antigen ligase family protein [Microbacterium invictum]|uniref:O-antigen ligase n=1 Tax=Microbacterium invictum TaxID=515415 RepID=A0AA40SP21_9MICO|nr:O-antigen ligase family protein [Microbacterium invictum]MBB4139751.1 O-antigen ligase [Microbacterium invictum]